MTPNLTSNQAALDPKFAKIIDRSLPGRKHWRFAEFPSLLRCSQWRGGGVVAFGVGVGVVAVVVVLTVMSIDSKSR